MIRACAGGRSSSAAESCWPRATRQGVRGAHRDGWQAGPAAVPDAVVVPPRMSAYSDASKAAFASSTKPRRSSRGYRSTRRSRRSRARADLGDAERDRRAAASARCATASVCRSPSVWRINEVPRQGGEWRRQTRQMSSCLPDRELSFLHPLPVERLWGVGAGDREEAARAGDSDGRARWPGFGDHARDDSRPGGGPAPVCGRHNRDPRPVIIGRRRGSIGSQCALGRSRKTPEAVDAVLVSLVDRVPAGCASPDVSAGRSCCDCASAITCEQRGRTRCPADRAHADDSAHRSLATGGCDAGDRARGLTLVGIAVANLEDDAPSVDVASRPLQRQRPGRRARRSARRLGSTAVTRAVLLGRDGD